MFYLVRTPRWLEWLYNKCVWSMPPVNKTIYLTFDDGPHPTITPFVLEQLRQYQAKATFFCIGKNVALHHNVYKALIEQGHTTGNHTFNHLNGWKSTDEDYFSDIQRAETLIKSNLFRPPYGRIRKSQISQLLETNLIDNIASPTLKDKETQQKIKVMMWSVLSGDFDPELTQEKCLNNVIKYAKSGSIIVFHDSEKAFSKLQYVLPKVLKYYAERGYVFESLS